MTTNTYDAAAATLKDAPLGNGSLSVNRKTWSELPTPVTSAVTAKFVGSPSADLAIAVADPAAITAATGGQIGVSIADLLHPTLVAAAEPLGSGILSDSTVADATDLFNDGQALTFEVTDASGDPVAWFAIRANATHSTATAIDAAGKLSRISNVEMALTVEIGRTRMSVRDVLGVEPGHVIELDRSAGAPADILLNGRLIAHGEIVVVDQDYAVRVTSILDAAEELA